MLVIGAGCAGGTWRRGRVLAGAAACALVLVASACDGSAGPDPLTTDQPGAAARARAAVWDVRVVAVTDPYLAGVVVPAKHHAVLVSFTATNTGRRPTDFVQSEVLALADQTGGWFEPVDDPWSDAGPADHTAVAVGDHTVGSAVFAVRDGEPTAQLQLVVGKEMAIRPVSGLPDTAYTVPLVPTG